MLTDFFLKYVQCSPKPSSWDGTELLAAIRTIPRYQMSGGILKLFLKILDLPKVLAYILFADFWMHKYSMEKVAPGQGNITELPLKANSKYQKRDNLDEGKHPKIILWTGQNQANSNVAKELLGWFRLYTRASFASLPSQSGANRRSWPTLDTFSCKRN